MSDVIRHLKRIVSSELHSAIECFVSGSIQARSPSNDDKLRQALKMYLKGDYTVLEGRNEGEVVACHLFDMMPRRPATNAGEYFAELRQFRETIVAPLEKSMCKRGRPHDVNLDYLFWHLDIIYDAISIPSSLGSHTDDAYDFEPPPRVKFAQGVLSLAAALGLDVLESCPDVDEDTKAKARSYFRYCRNKSARSIGEAMGRTRMRRHAVGD
jgi:hypothetical protein